jgi:hypothetical protein
MKQCRKLPFWSMGLLVLSLNARLLVADASGHPYTGIAARNVFGLGPLVAQPPSPPLAPLPKIMLVGITTILQDKRALLKVQFPAQPPEPAREVSCTLTLGQREGPIEVLAIALVGGALRREAGGLGGTRTRDQRLKRPLLYRLSYQPTTAKEKPTCGPGLAGLSQRGIRRQNQKRQAS